MANFMMFFFELKRLVLCCNRLCLKSSTLQKICLTSLVIISFATLADDLRIMANTSINDIIIELRQEITQDNLSAIRFKVLTSSTVEAALLWNNNNQIIYPIKEEITYINENLILHDISRFNLLLQTANPINWEQRDASAILFHYCRKDIESTCLIIDTLELSAQLGVSHDALTKAILAQPELATNRYVLLVFMVMISTLLLIIYRKRSQKKQTKEDTDAFTLGDLLIKPKQQLGIRDSLSISLTSRDIKLLNYMALHTNEVLSKDQLYAAGWGREFLPNSRALEQHIMVLRRKLDPGKNRPVLIETIHGQGYKCPSSL